MRQRPVYVLFLTLQIPALLGHGGTALARTIVVAKDGTGDAQTVQEGVSLLWGGLSCCEVDTLLVRAGSYDEDVSLPTPADLCDPSRPGQGALLLCPDELPATVVRSVTLPSLTGGCRRWFWEIKNLSVQDTVRPGVNLDLATWRGCTFLGGYEASSDNCLTPNLVGCEFRGATLLSGYSGSTPFDSCVFLGATLQVATSTCGLLILRGCVFRGAPDTAVVAASWGDAWVLFEDCVFESTQVGVSAQPGSRCWEEFRFDRCRFSAIAQQAISYEDNPPDNASCRPVGLRVWDSRFTHCGHAVRWRSTAPGWLELARDTMTGGRLTAIDATVRSTSIEALWIEGGTGGFDLQEVGETYYVGGTPRLLRIANCTIRDVSGDGIVVRYLEPRADYPAPGLGGNVITHAAGAGIRIEAPAGAQYTRRWMIARNIVGRSLGPGIVAQCPTTGPLVAQNTCYLDTGPGLRVVGDSTTSVVGNISFGNSGVGLDTGNAPWMEVRCNDWYGNWQGETSGSLGRVGLDNLSVNPQFCDVAHDSVSLAHTSPLLGLTTCGQIGAAGVGCFLTTALGSKPAFALGVTPQPSLGRATFSWNRSLGTARLEVFDAVGALIWRTSVEPGVISATWDGSDRHGRRVPAGVLFARLHADVGEAVIRFVFIR